MPTDLIQAPESAMRIAVCAETGAIDARPVIRVHADADRETESAEWIPCLAGVRVRAGD